MKGRRVFSSLANTQLLRTLVNMLREVRQGYSAHTGRNMRAENHSCGKCDLSHFPTDRNQLTRKSFYPFLVVFTALIAFNYPTLGGDMAFRAGV